MYPVDFHGFVVSSDNAILSYKCDNYYDKESEVDIMYNNETLSISEEDLINPSFENAESFESL